MWNGEFRHPTPIFRKGCEDNKQLVTNNPDLAAICTEALSKQHVDKSANEARRQQQREIETRKVQLSKGLNRIPMRRRRLTMPSLQQQIL